MRATILAQLLAAAVASAAPAGVDKPTDASQAFRAGSVAQRQSILVQIIRHELPTTPDNIAAIIESALGDADARVREAALAAVVSRAAGPRFAPKAPGSADWGPDRDAIQRLRPQVTTALDDNVEAVRVQAISALASLDFDISEPELQLKPGTARVLLSRFYKEPSPIVRARIVAGFSTDPGADSPEIRKLLVDAFRDGDHRVRHAATPGAQKLGGDGTALLVHQLDDPSRTVRLEAASVLVKVGPGALPHAAAIEDALRREHDAVVQQRLRAVLAAMKAK